MVIMIMYITLSKNTIYPAAVQAHSKQRISLPFESELDEVPLST
jgi:hypothetical protein